METGYIIQGAYAKFYQNSEVIGTSESRLSPIPIKN
jgi:hypothetical protein